MDEGNEDWDEVEEGERGGKRSDDCGGIEEEKRGWNGRREEEKKEGEEK